METVAVLVVWIFPVPLIVQVFRQVFPVQSLAVAERVSELLSPRTIIRQDAVVPLKERDGCAAGSIAGPEAWAVMPKSITRIRDSASSCFLIQITSLHFVFSYCNE